MAQGTCAHPTPECARHARTRPWQRQTSELCIQYLLDLHLDSLSKSSVGRIRNCQFFGSHLYSDCAWSMVVLLKNVKHNSRQCILLSHALQFHLVYTSSAQACLVQVQARIYHFKKSFKSNIGSRHSFEPLNLPSPILTYDITYVYKNQVKQRIQNTT